MLPRNPRSREELTYAATLAQAMLLLDSARAYGLVEGGPDVDVARCEELLAEAEDREIVVHQDDVDQAVAQIVLELTAGGAVA